MQYKRKSDLNLVALDDYFKRARYRPRRADQFALAAPPVTFIAIGAVGIHGHAVNNCKRTAGTDLRTKTATVTFLYSYYRYHLRFHPLYSIQV